MKAAGRLLAGRYRLHEVIGRGGMSTVYRATDQVLGRTVALKILLATLADQDPTYATRFEREARAAASLDNPSVVTIYDTGVDDGSHYIVMEYIAGRSLEEILRAGTAFELTEAARIAVAVADALASAHAAGILHRDIKPANVMVADAGSVKVLDFGIARRQDGTAITQVASVVGTASYMAPERALGQPGDARADIYSLGCLLYAMLTGVPPFSGEIAASVLHQQINAAPRPPRAMRAGVPSALDALVLAMLAKAPDDRPGSAAQVRDDLLALAGTPPTARATAVTQPLPPRASVIPPPRTGKPGHGILGDHRRRAVVMALLTGLITLIAVALLSGGGSSRRGATRSTAATTRSTPVTTHTSTPSSAAQPATQPATTPAAAPPRPKPRKPKAGGPPGPAGGPPGHGGQPPGQAKKKAGPSGA